MPPDQPVTVIIPARYASSRFPGKPLVSLSGRTLIEHMYRQATRSRCVSQVIVATDDRRIFDAVNQFGGKAVLTEGSYRTGTDRVAAIARDLPGDIFVNLQGDEIPLHENLLTDLIVPFQNNQYHMGTLKRKLTNAKDLDNRGVVKVVTNAQGEALYFSRAPIPLVRDPPHSDHVSELHYIHLGVYIYTRATLQQFAALPTGPLEDAEKLEQLRALDQGIPIQVWETAHPSLRIDCPDDVPDAARQLLHFIDDGTLSPQTKEAEGPNFQIHEPPI